MLTRRSKKGRLVDTAIDSYGAGRLLFGIGCLVSPATIGGLFGGNEGAAPAARGAWRSVGIRDLLHGGSLLKARRSGAPTGALLWIGGACGVVDVLAVAADRDHLPASGRNGLLAAGSDALTGVALALVERRH